MLVKPQLGENIGTAARAMANCGLDDLRLVAPRDGWPNDKAVGGGERRRLRCSTRRGSIPNIAAAVADLSPCLRRHRARPLYGQARRHRARAAAEMRGFLAAGEGCGVLFGPERTGLVNEDIALADTVLSVPLNPAFSSLNLAQAVLIVGYEWFIASAANTPPKRCIPAAAARRTRPS